ncbi:MAG TPA: hypothetical protein VH249_21370 [Xanthobacteraceae bacterium]|jgi:hypothetical protein|nr:hypothetical protein [Xanthobacteraceae bacterium]
MDKGFYLALGVALLLPFLQYALPVMPKSVAWTGVAAGILVMLIEFLAPEMKPSLPVVFLFLIGVLCLGWAGHLYFRQPIWTHVAEKPKAAAEPVGQKPTAPSVEAQQPQSNAMFQLGGAKNTIVERNRIVGPIKDRVIFDVRGHETTIVRDNDVIDQIPTPQAERITAYATLSNAQFKGVVSELTGQLRSAEQAFSSRLNAVMAIDPAVMSSSAELRRQRSQEVDAKLVELTIGHQDNYVSFFAARCQKAQAEILWRLVQAGVTKIEIPATPIMRAFDLRSGFRHVQLGSIAGATPMAAVADYLEFIAGRMPD